MMRMAVAIGSVLGPFWRHCSQPPVGRRPHPISRRIAQLKFRLRTRRTRSRRPAKNRHRDPQGAFRRTRFRRVLTFDPAGIARRSGGSGEDMPFVPLSFQHWPSLPPRVFLSLITNFLSRLSQPFSFQFSLSHFQRRVAFQGGPPGAAGLIEVVDVPQIDRKRRPFALPKTNRLFFLQTVVPGQSSHLLTFPYSYFSFLLSLFAIFITRLPPFFVPFAPPPKPV